MVERLGHGELVMHFRRHVDGGLRQPIECGVTHGCITAVIEDVHCTPCKEIAARADELAMACGCRNGYVHRAVARVQVEKARQA
jgi:hypothetical protein